MLLANVCNLASDYYESDIGGKLPWGLEAQVGQARVDLERMPKRLKGVNGLAVLPFAAPIHTLR